MNGISYASGNQYCVLSIAKSQAVKCGIDDPNEVKIQVTRDGILIKKKCADVCANTSPEFKPNDGESKVDLNED